MLDSSGNEINSDLTKGKNWNSDNTMTLLTWITIGSCFIKFLDSRISHNRYFIRVNTIQSIILNTATGSIGVSQISSILTPQVQLILTLIFTLFSFTLTITTGLIKVFQIHENLEKNIQIRQEWASFIISISTELQLPIEERQDALKLIRDNKNIYLSLLNKDIESDKIDTRITLSSTVRELNEKLDKINNDIQVRKSKLNSFNGSTLVNNHKNFSYESQACEALAIKTHIDLLNNIGVSISDITTGIVQSEMKYIYIRGLYDDDNGNKHNFNDSDDDNNSVIDFSIRDALKNKLRGSIELDISDDHT
jgi:hypothetical protein